MNLFDTWCRVVATRNQTPVLHVLVIVAVLLAVFYHWPALSLAQGLVATVDIRVVDAQAEQPLNQVKVELLAFPDRFVQMAHTGSSGRVELFNIPLGSYIVRASHAGYTTADVRIDIRRGESTKFVELRLQSVRSGETLTTVGVVSERTLAIPAPALKQMEQGIRLLNEKKDAKRSLQHFRKAIELYPPYYEAYFMLGMAHVQLNSPGQAQLALEKAIELNPTFLEPYYPLSVLLMSEKKYEQAEHLLQKAMQLDTKDWKWPFELARCHASRGQWDKALSYAEMAHAHPNPPSKVHILMADLYSGVGQTVKAVEELEKFIKLDPTSPYVPRVKAALKQLRQGND